MHLLERGNDLQEQFWPVFHFLQNNFRTNHEIAFWNKLSLSGIPILPDPQFPIFYPPILLFLFLPTDIAFIFYFILHTFLGGLGIYNLSKNWLKTSEKISLFSAALYVFSPKLASYLEAGHYGLIGTHAWIPWLLIGIISFNKAINLRASVVFAISLAGLFYTHTLVFLSSLFFSVLIFFSQQFRKPFSKKFMYFTTGLFLAVGFTAITLFPQMEWSKVTTRFLLLENPDVYPKWNSIFEYINVLFVPWLNGLKNMWRFDSEKWIVIGILPSLISLVGFMKLKLRNKIFLSIFVFTIFFLSLNNLNPFDYFLLEQKWYILMRVSTRIWFAITLLIPLLTAYGLLFIEKRVNKNLFNFLLLATLLEYMFLSWGYLAKPRNILEFAPREVYEYLSSDHDTFRVYCTTRCLSQKESSKRNLELIEGYNTLHQKNYFNKSWDLMGGYWNYYTLPVPPFQEYLYKNLQPNAKLLGEFNTKYVISPFELIDQNFRLIKKVDKYYIYKNTAYLPRTNSKIISRSANRLVLNTTNLKKNPLVVRDVYNSGWRAFLKNKQEVKINENENSHLSIDIPENTDLVEIKYLPKTYVLGALVSAFSLGIILIIIRKYK